LILAAAMPPETAAGDFSDTKLADSEAGLCWFFGGEARDIVHREVLNSTSSRCFLYWGQLMTGDAERD
jgi:hypothetical protein